MTVDQIIDDVLAREGGWVDDPIDRGGCTNRGITLKTFQTWRGTHQATCDELRAMAEDEARAIYRQQYVELPGFAAAIPDGRLLALVVDFAVLSGPQTATKALQRAIGIADDGVIGAQTARLLASQSGSVEVYKKLLADRIRLHCEIVLTNPSQRRFLRGWLSRLVGFL